MATHSLGAGHSFQRGRQGLPPPNTHKRTQSYKSGGFKKPHKKIFAFWALFLTVVGLCYWNLYSSQERDHSIMEITQEGTSQTEILTPGPWDPVDNTDMPPGRTSGPGNDANQIIFQEDSSDDQQSQHDDPSLPSKDPMEPPEEPVGDDDDNKDEGIIDKILNWFWGLIKAPFSWLWEMIKAPFSWLWEMTMAAISWLWVIVEAPFAWLWEIATGAISWLWGIVEAPFTWLWEVATIVLGPAWEWVTQTCSVLWSSLLENMPCIKIGLPYSLLGAVFGAFALPLGLPVMLCVLGYCAGGIVAGTIGALCMSFHGGATPAGGIVATFQFLGTQSFSFFFNAPTIGLGAVIGFIGGGYYAFTDLCPLV
ncbi:hypothetical protein EDD21DRAFT_404464 [Dissophora ornata]|nr:hypothetical protein EDD21DRAFT_404464 [Dissophora ornata]